MVGVTWRSKSATVTSSVTWWVTGVDWGGVYVAVMAIGYVPFGARGLAVTFMLTGLPAEVGFEAKATVNPAGVPVEESESCWLKLFTGRRVICDRTDFVR